MTIQYIPVAAQLHMPTDTTVNEYGVVGEKAWEFVVSLVKGFFAFLSVAGEALEPVFVVVAICGFFLIMAGLDKWGYRLTSGSLLGYGLCKVCDLAW